MYLDNACVITLGRREDRLERFLRRSEKHLFPWFKTVTAWLAVDDPVDPDRGCLASHLQVLNNLAGPLLVLEDDACFSDDFTLSLTPPHDWDILWLGGQHRLAPLPVNSEWVTPTYLVRTHAYIVREPKTIAGLMQNAPRMDPYMASLPVKQYALRTNTVGQMAGLSDITGQTRGSDEYWQLRYHPRFHGGKPHPSSGQY